MKELTDGSTTETVKNRDGSTRIATRASRGMFCKKDDPPTVEETQAALLTKVTEVSADGGSILERILDRTISNAQMDPERDVYNKMGIAVGKAVDPRIMGSSVKAAEVILKASGLAQPKKEVEQQNRVSIVNIVMPPEVLAEIMKRQGGTIQEFSGYGSRPTPAFLDAEIITDEPRTPVAPVPVQAIAKTKDVSVSWLMGVNQAEMDKRSRGVSMSFILTKAKDETLCCRQDGSLVRGHYIVLAAHINSRETVSAEILA